jgi:hypothetical protein
MKSDLRALGVAQEVEAVKTKRVNHGDHVIDLLRHDVPGCVMRLAALTVTARIDQNELKVIL